MGTITITLEHRTILKHDILFFLKDLLKNPVFLENDFGLCWYLEKRLVYKQHQERFDHTNPLSPYCFIPKLRKTIWPNENCRNYLGKTGLLTPKRIELANEIIRRIESNEPLFGDELE